MDWVVSDKNLNKNYWTEKQKFIFKLLDIVEIQVVQIMTPGGRLGSQSGIRILYASTCTEGTFWKIFFSTIIELEEWIFTLKLLDME